MCTIIALRFLALIFLFKEKDFSLTQTSLLSFREDNHSFSNAISENKGLFQIELVCLFREKDKYAKQQGRLTKVGF